MKRIAFILCLLWSVAANAAYTEKYVTDAGAGAADGSNLANAWSWATMLTTLAAGQRANYNGTITRTTSTDSFTNAGTIANPMAIRAVDGSGNPISSTRTSGQARTMTGIGVITYTTGALTIPAFMELDNVSITSARAGVTLTTVNSSQVTRSVIANTHASSASAIGIAGGGNIDDSDISCASSSTSAFAISSSALMTISRCLVTGNTAGAVAINCGNRTTIIACMIRDANKGIAWASASGGSGAESCSLRNITNEYFDNSGGSSEPFRIVNCAAWGSGGSSKFYNSSTSVRSHYQNYNAVGNMGASDTNPGNWPVRNQVTLTADPFTSSTDLTLNSTSGGGAACKGAGGPAYIDIGAWQVQASSGAAPVFSPGGVFAP